jgi:hypothetical protein
MKTHRANKTVPMPVSVQRIHKFSSRDIFTASHTFLSKLSEVILLTIGLAVMYQVATVKRMATFNAKEVAGMIVLAKRTNNILKMGKSQHSQKHSTLSFETCS